MRRRMKAVLPALLTTFVTLSTAVSAQQPTGRIEGRLVDGRMGGAVAGLQVEIRGPGVQRTVLSAAAGTFTFADLPPGEYTLRVAVPGAQPFERGVRVDAGAVVQVRMDVRDAVVALDPLTAAATPLPVRPGETEFGVRIGPQALRMLPVSYDPATMAGLAAGVTGDRIWGGAAREANLYQLDGLTLTHPGSGGFLVPLSPSWVEAVEVRGLGAGADIGNFQGGVVNLVLRSGSVTPRSRVRASMETHTLNAQHRVTNEISRERSARRDVEADWSGPLRADRLYLFTGAHLLRDEYRARDHLPGDRTSYLPHEEERTEARGVARLSWTPDARNRVDITGIAGHARGRNWALTGYEAEGAAPDYAAPSGVALLGWRRLLGSASRFELRASHATLSEEWTAPAGSQVPAVRIFTFGDPPTPVFGNPVFEVHRRPSLSAATATLSHALRAAGTRHELDAGAEMSRGEWIDRRMRTGGMTWRPVGRAQLDAAQPATWFSSGFVPTEWGGEVDLHARTTHASVFLQDRVTLHPQLWLSAGVRASAWRGDLLPQGEAARRIRALRTAAWEPRLGLVAEPVGGGSILLKAHWGRYHQNLLATMFDRVEGAAVFSDRELWYYHAAAAPASPATTFTAAQRDAMQTGDPRFIQAEVLRLNEAGRVAEDLRQPYMEQWLAGVEAGIGGWLRFEAVFVDRRNRSLVGLIDRNLEANYHRFENVQVRTTDGEPVIMGGRPLTLPAVHVPWSAIRRQLTHIMNQASVPMPPGFSLADLDWIVDETPDLVLANIPDARRSLQQLQLTARATRTDWGGWISLALSRLEGNLDSATGYEAGTGYERFWELGAGPWVRPNEQVNFAGRLPGVHPIELKAAVHGRLPWSLRAGALLEARRGEYFTPYLTLSTLGHRFFVGDAEIGSGMIYDVAGQRSFVNPRGQARYADRVTLDLRLERDLPLRGGNWSISADIFNVWNTSTATRINPSVTYTSTETGMFTRVPEPWVFGAVWERLPPRTLRLGLSRGT